MFRTMIEERVREREVFVFDTTPPDQQERERDTSEIVEYVSAGLERQLEEMSTAVEQPGALDAEREFGGLGSRSDLLRHVSARLVSDMRFQPIGRLHLTLFANDVVFSPPYADEWQSGGGLALGAVADGSLTTFGSMGYSVAGVNLYVTSNTSSPVSAAITPVGAFNWSWTTFEDLPSLQSRGGLGFSVRLGGATLTQRDSAMWLQSGAPAFTGDSDEGELANAASMASPPFGPIDFFPVVVPNMRPGEQYLFSLWCWQFAQYPENAAFLSFMNAKMSAVALSLGPPIHIS